MFYEERVIDGQLMWRGDPKGEWRPMPSACQYVAAFEELIALTDEQRMDAFRLFCTHCGTVQTAFRCQCWNDE